MWPTLLNLGLHLSLPGGWALRAALEYAWLCAFGGISVLALGAAWQGWRLLHSAGMSIDDLIEASSSRDALLAWWSGRLDLRPQLVASLAGAVGSVALLRVLTPEVATHLRINVVSYLSVGWAGAVCGAALYWCLILTFLAWRIFVLDDLALVWHSPASGAAVRRLSMGYAFASAAVLMASVAAELLALKIPNRAESRLVGAVSLAFPFSPFVAVSLTFAVGLLPHFWLRRAVVRRRDRSLVTISKLLPSDPPSDLAGLGEVSLGLEAYRRVETAPLLPFSTTTMVEYAAALLGSLAAFLLTR